jgi:RND family efflux transporter MFP subunit
MMQTKSSFNFLRAIIATISADYEYVWLERIKINVKNRYSGPATLFLSLLVMVVFPVVVIAGPAGPGSGPPPLVTVTSVIEKDVNPPTEYVGHVEAIQSVDLRARVEGFLKQVNFKEGSDVHAGDLLYVIEKAPYQARVDAAKASLAQAEATLNKARQYLHRAQTVRSGGISATDLDNAVAEELRAKAQLEQVRANLQIAQINLGYTSIRAPIGGRIGRTAFTRGNLVNLGSGSLARIIQIDPIRAVFSISENDLVAIKAALKDTAKDKKHPILTPRIKLPDGQILKTVGRVDFVDNAVDASTGTIAVRAVFTNPGGMLLPGQYITVLIARSQPKLMTVVPQAAVLEDHDGRYVLLVDDKNRVAIRRIQTGPVIGVNWAAKSGLTVNDKVIVEGVQKVRPGQLVKTTATDQQQER